MDFRENQAMLGNSLILAHPLRPPSPQKNGGLKLLWFLVKGMCHFLLLSVFRMKVRVQPSSWWNWEFLATGAIPSIPASIASGYMENQSLKPSWGHTCASWLPQVLRLKSDKRQCQKGEQRGLGSTVFCCVARMWGVGTQQPPCGQFILSVQGEKRAPQFGLL